MGTLVGRLSEPGNAQLYQYYVSMQQSDNAASQLVSNLAAGMCRDSETQGLQIDGRVKWLVSEGEKSGGLDEAAAYIFAAAHDADAAGDYKAKAREALKLLGTDEAKVLIDYCTG